MILCIYEYHLCTRIFVFWPRLFHQWKCNFLFDLQFVKRRVSFIVVLKIITENSSNNLNILICVYVVFFFLFDKDNIWKVADVHRKHRSSKIAVSTQRLHQYIFSLDLQSVCDYLNDLAVQTKTLHMGDKLRTGQSQPNRGISNHQGRPLHR